MSTVFYVVFESWEATNRDLSLPVVSLIFIFFSNPSVMFSVLSLREGQFFNIYFQYINPTADDQVFIDIYFC